MPIRPENRERYPANWRAISLAIRRDRAHWRCECPGVCGTDHVEGRCLAVQYQPHPITGSRVILTTAHLDHQPENCDPANLLALCQRCHLRYDRHHHAQTAARTRALAASGHRATRAPGDHPVTAHRGAARARAALQRQEATP